MKRLPRLGRPAPTPVLLATGLSVLALAQALGENRGAAATAVALVGTAAVVLVLRRPLPGIAAIAASVLGQALLQPGEPIFASFLATLVGCYALGRRSRLPEIVAGLSLLAVSLAVLLLLDRSQPLVELVYPAVYFGAALGLGRLARARERAADDALAAAEQEAQAREEAALAAERARIAREMHDVVAHSVSLLVVQAEGAAAVVGSDPDRTRAQLDRVCDSGRQALDELRRLLGVLRTDSGPAGTGPQPTLRELHGLLEGVQRSGADVHLSVSPGLDALSPGLQLTAYRVVQESVTNALRHGQARHLDVRLCRVADALEIEVTDDGAGAPDGQPGHGLSGMRERVKLYGGALEAGPRPEGGWRVLARTPVTP